MINEKTESFEITEKSSNSPDSYFLKLAYKGSGVFRIASKNPGGTFAIVALTFLAGMFLNLIGAAGILHDGDKHTPLLFIFLGIPLAAFSVFLYVYINKLESKITPHVFDWLASHLKEESIYFSTGSEFNNASVSLDTGFSFHGDVIHRKVGDGKYISKLPTGIFILTGIINNIEFSVHMSALTKSKAILALRDRKDLLLEFFPDDVKINAALKAGEA